MFINVKAVKFEDGLVEVSLPRSSNCWCSRHAKALYLQRRRVRRRLSLSPTRSSASVPNDAAKTLIEDIKEALEVTVHQGDHRRHQPDRGVAGHELLRRSGDVDGHRTPRWSSSPSTSRSSRLEDRLNAAGNNILVNDKGALVNPGDQPDALQLIEDILQVEVFPMTVAGHKTVGSCLRGHQQGRAMPPRDQEGRVRRCIKSVMKVPAAIGTLNYGSPMVGACIVANSKGGAVGFRLHAHRARQVRGRVGPLLIKSFTFPLFFIDQSENIQNSYCTGKRPRAGTPPRCRHG